MKSFPILLGCSLAVNIGNISLASQPTTATQVLASKSKTITFLCQTRGSSVTVLLNQNLKYTANATASPPTGGKYVIAGPAYRFKTGGLKDSSIVRQNGGVYLVATIDEAKAAELAAVDRALFCQ